MNNKTIIETEDAIENANMTPISAEDDRNDDKADNVNASSKASVYPQLFFTWDKDIHPEFLDAFLEETTELVSELASFLQHVSTTNVDSEKRYHVSRLAHTIKGGSAVAEMTALSQFSYQLEQILEYSIKHELAEEIPALLAEASTCLENLFAAAKEKSGEPKIFASVFSRLLAYTETLEEDDEPISLGKPRLPDFITQQKPDASLDLEQEVNDVADRELDDIIMTLSTASSWNEYTQELHALTLWAEGSGFSEIVKASQWCQQNIALFEANPSDEIQAFVESGECWLWLEFISAIQSDPAESSHLAALTTELMRDDWVKPFALEDLPTLLMQLKNLVNDESSGNRVSGESDKGDDNESNTATRVNYTFKWDDDIHPELLSSYLQETPDQVSQVAGLLIKIAKGDATKADHQHASRIAHTIKGSSGVVGISALVEFTHKLEDILDYSINHPLPEEISRLLAASSNCLEDTFDAILNKEVEPEEFAPLLSQLAQYSETLEQDDLFDESLAELLAAELPDFITDEQPASDVIALADTQEPDFSGLISTTNDITNDLNISDSTNKASVTLETDTTIRVPVTIIDKLLNLVGELVTTSSQVADKIDKSIDTSNQIKIQDIRVHKMLEELDTTLAKQEHNQFKAIANLPSNDFDNLEMDTYNELHSISGLLKESILDAEAIEANLAKQLLGIKDFFHSFDLLNNDLSDVILRSRRVSINSLIPRLERIVRQTCNKTKKKTELVVIGNDINVDTDILNGLTDPLLHLLRNAIDHGIEFPADRQAKKKDKTGLIKLAFSKQGNYIQLELNDDGAGIDAEKIYQQAIKKGIIVADQQLSNNEKLQLILYAGFSTQENVTDISGRGVGMDVVNTAVKALNGTLDIKSDIGKGTSFTLKIPMTLVTSATLLVSISGYNVAIPSESIEQIHYLLPEMVLEREQGYFIRHNGKELPIQSLGTLIGLPAHTPDFSKSNTLLFIEGLNETHVIYIDKIIHSRKAVIKSLSEWLDTSKGLMGACHLPDGGVAPVINLPQLLRLNEKTNQVIKQIQLDSAQQTPQETASRILVVDDSLSNRKALSLIIEQTDCEVVTAVDGLDALQIMNETHIDLIFTDLEMPRMNGIELTQAIRVWDDKKEIPIVMITSRTTSKHRQLAKKAGVDDYLTKPVVTEVLLNSITQWLEKAVV